MSLRRSAQAVVSLSVLAQGAGFAKNILIAHYFGINAELDGYYLSQTLPALFVGILIGGLQTGFVPVYAALVARRDEAAPRLRGSLLSWLVIILSISSSVTSLAAPWVTDLIASAAPPAVAEATGHSLRVLAFMLLLNGIGDYLAMVLNAELRFVAAAAAPAANAISAALFLYLWPELGLNNLLSGLVIGGVIQLVVLAVACYRAGITFRPSLAFSAEAYKVGRLAVAIVPALACSNMTATLPQWLATPIGEGAVSAFAYASRLHGALLQTTGMAISNLLLGSFSVHIARREVREVVRVLNALFLHTASFSLVFMVWILLVGRDFIRLVLGHGRFDLAAESAVYWTWLSLSVAVFPMLWGGYFARVFQALQRPRFINVLAVIGLSVLAVAGWLLRGLFGVVGIALAASLAVGTTATLFHIGFRRYLGGPVLFPRVQRHLAVLTAIALGTAGIGWILTRVLPYTPMLSFPLACGLAALALWVAYQQAYRVISSETP